MIDTQRKIDALRSLMITGWFAVSAVACAGGGGGIHDSSSSSRSGEHAAVVDRAFHRTTVVLLDVTGSFRAREEAVRQVLAGLLGSLGPSDELLIATIGAPSFSSTSEVRVHSQMPDFPDSILTASTTTHDWRRKRARLARLWKEVGVQVEALARALSRPIERVNRGGTDVHGALAYAAHRLSGQPERERRLIVLSDLLHEEGGEQTSLPPTATIPLAGVRVIAAGVPWDEDRWTEKEGAWSAFVAQSGGISFSMMDDSEMLAEPLLPPTEVPRDLEPPALN